MSLGKNSLAWLWPAFSILAFVSAVAMFALWWVNRPPAETATEVTFVRAMVAHHAQAVEMSVIVRDRTTDADLRQLMLDIILTQQGQMGLMQGWLMAWGHSLMGVTAPMDHGDHGGHGNHTDYGMASAAQVSALRSLDVSAAEIEFLQLMIRHHEGGVLMAQEALPTLINPDVRALAQGIIDGQNEEIIYMRDLLTARGIQP